VSKEPKILRAQRATNQREREMEMQRANDTTTTDAEAPRAASVAYPTARACIPQRVRATLDRHAKQVVRARLEDHDSGASSRVSRARADELSAEAVQMSEISEARSIARRKQSRAQSHTETAPSFIARRGQDLSQLFQTSAGAAGAQAPSAENSLQPAERDGTTMAKKKARLVEKAEFRPYASVMRKASNT